MVRAINTQGGLATTDKIAPKARIGAFSSIPRVMRARVERASEPKPARKMTEESMGEESQGGHQPLVKSSSGKIALGPWSGPFGSGSMSDDDAPVLYLDVWGHAHETLNDVPAPFDANPRTQRNDAKKALDSPKKPVHLLSAAMPRMAGCLKVHEMEILAMQSRALMANSHKNGHHGKRGYSRNRGMGVINQPRKF